MVIESIAADARVKGLAARLTRGGVVHATGLWGSSAPMLTALLARSAARTFLFVTAHLEEADDARDDIELFLDAPCELFPAWESVPGEGAGANEIQAERLRICSQLRSTQQGNETSKASSKGRRAAARTQPIVRAGSIESRILVAPIFALMQPVPSPEALASHTLSLVAGQVTTALPLNGAAAPDALLQWAVDRGFSRLDLVEAPGDVARRGDVVDLFVPGEIHPYRIQFEDDRIEAIRRFDIGTQRSIEVLPSAVVLTVPERMPLGESETDIFAYLPSDTWVVFDDPPAIQELGRTLERRMGGSASARPVTDVFQRASGFNELFLTRFTAAAAKGEDVIEFGVTSVARFEGEAAAAVEELRRAASDHEIHVFCDNEGERQRLHEMLTTGPGTEADARHRGDKEGHSIAPRGAPKAALQVPSSIHLHVGTLHHGFAWTATRTIVVSHHELFHRHRHRRRLRRLYAGKPLESWIDLKPGEYVVHVNHGIAVYRGMTKLRKGASEQQEEFLTLEFAEEAVIHVPCSQVDLVQKYIGAGGRRPQLSKLGGKRWSRMKEQVAEAVTDLAESLLRIQALRERAAGTAYPADTDWQREFEAAFPYEETEDQLVVAGEIRGDLVRSRPMDRVVCGDVGYGKTELAMRAAFKVVEFGRQVAVLVPTTVLAEQHFETFKERMAEYPFAIGCLSRFRSGAEQKKILTAAKKGQVDVVIGTHRLLSKDVSFADLGLVIIDEEQRFGVEHKERLKAMRETVDVLTLTATPIPRTLHMALMGIRDISSLQTPPVDRRAIATYVRPFDRPMIRDAIMRELNREGQVFFVHNFVQSIAEMADTVRSIVPEARVAFAHGQMKDEQLEEVVHRFSRKEADVLVTTTIIESGIDMPSVNTIFINRAERFGLADLHQLRGRVGRSSHRAYCYLLLSPDRPPTGNAAKRLKTVEEFSELGAGFRIAMRDLEIRGAGNILGKEQSGHIAAVGYEMYCRLLEQTVRRLKNEPDPNPPPVQIDLDVEAHIPKSYITSDRLRIAAYRRVVGCTTPADLESLEKDFADAFGQPPAPVRRMIELAEIRVHARRYGILSISLRGPDVVFIVDNVAKADAMFKKAPGSVRVPDGKTVHLRLPPAYLERETLLPILRRMLIRSAVPVEART